uniref:Expressed conserved protein n=1 Tax=Echinococcus granulosus TaxID=6210 RepID=A0A068X0A9_ECHGR|nr:expressed conserved protein [Echinococcus granulosus]
MGATNSRAVCHSAHGDWLLPAEPSSELPGKHKIPRTATHHLVRVRVSSGCVRLSLQSPINTSAYFVSQPSLFISRLFIPNQDGDNPPKKIPTRTYSGSSVNKKPKLFKALSKRKDETARKSATLQPTRTGDNLQVPSEAATEPILVSAASCEVRSSPVVLECRTPGVADGKVAQEPAAPTKDAIPVKADSILKEEEAETPAKIEKHPTGSEEQTVVENADAIAQEVADEVIEGSMKVIEKEVVEVEKEVSPKDIEEPKSQMEECQSKGEFDEPEPEPINEVVRDHQESEVAEILVNEALNAGVEAEAAEKQAALSAPIDGEQPGSSLEEQRPQSSDQSSDYVEALQQSQSVSEAFGDPNEVSDGTKNIEVACLNDKTRDGELKDVPEDEKHEVDVKTEEIAPEGEDVIPPDNSILNGHDEVQHGDDAGADKDGCLEGGPESDPTATSKASVGEDVEHNKSTAFCSGASHPLILLLLSLQPKPFFRSSANLSLIYFSFFIRPPPPFEACKAIYRVWPMLFPFF